MDGFGLVGRVQAFCWKRKLAKKSTDLMLLSFVTLATGYSVLVACLSIVHRSLE